MAWSSKTYVFACVCVVAMCMLFLKLYTDMRPPVSETNTVFVRTPAGPDVNVVIAELIRQRNNVSRQLNRKQQMIGQMECEKSGTDNAVSTTGGWCNKSSREDGGNHLTDKRLIPILAGFFEGKYVGSFGDGPGRYKQLLLDTGKLKGYDAYDGAPYGDTTSDGRVAFLDLTLPQYGLPMYDWIMSLEVAEHIPAQFESTFIDNVVRHAKEGVVLSWAVPGQGGHSHVNNRALEYVINLFNTLGFSHDPEASKVLQAAATFSWLKGNTNVYRRRDQGEMEKSKFMYV